MSRASCFTTVVAMPDASRPRLAGGRRGGRAAETGAGGRKSRDAVVAHGGEHGLCVVEAGDDVHLPPLRRQGRVLRDVGDPVAELGSPPAPPGLALGRRGSPDCSSGPGWERRRRWHRPANAARSSVPWPPHPWSLKAFFRPVSASVRAMFLTRCCEDISPQSLQMTMFRYGDIPPGQPRPSQRLFGSLRPCLPEPSVCFCRCIRQDISAPNNPIGSAQWLGGRWRSLAPQCPSHDYENDYNHDYKMTMAAEDRWHPCLTSLGGPVDLAVGEIYMDNRKFRSKSSLIHLEGPCLFEEKTTPRTSPAPKARFSRS